MLLFVVTAGMGIAYLLHRAGCRPGEPTCDYTRPNCSGGTACAFVAPGEARCVEAPPFAPPPLDAPFTAGHCFYCAQGGRSEAGRSHSYRSDLYALDLASCPTEGTSTVLAPADGEAHVFDGCEERAEGPDARNDSRCGLGYGNHVKIWDGTDLYLVAHLARVLVADGPVRRGQPIGVEGASGAAGARHVHLSVTRMAEGADVAEILSTPGWVGQVPVHVRLRARPFPGSAGPELPGGASLWYADALPCGAPGKAPRLTPAAPPR